jgi:hypothetical protein
MTGARATSSSGRCCRWGPSTRKTGWAARGGSLGQAPLGEGCAHTAAAGGFDGPLPPPSLPPPAPRCPLARAARWLQRLFNASPSPHHSRQATRPALQIAAPALSPPQAWPLPTYQATQLSPCLAVPPLSPPRACPLPTRQATQLSPWIVTLDALEPFRCEAEAQEPGVLPYLKEKHRWGDDSCITRRHATLLVRIGVRPRRRPARPGRRPAPPCPARAIQARV